MANPDDTTLPGEDFAEAFAPPPPVRGNARPHFDAVDRLVFFFSGFDPKGATFYHRLMRNGIGHRNATHDDTLALSGRLRVGRWASVWTTLWRGAPTVIGQRPPTMRTRVHFMRWDDIVRQHWRRHPVRLLRDYVSVYVGGTARGVLPRIRRLAPGAFRLAMFPFAVSAAAWLTGAAAVSAGLLYREWLPLWPALAAGLIGGGLAWRLVAASIGYEWQVRLYAFIRQQASGTLPQLENRQEEMALRVVEAVEARLRQPGAPALREVMVVGYSTGSIMAASVLARALPRLRELLGEERTNPDTTLSLLTLGHCIPVGAEWPAAGGLRTQLRQLAECRWLTWFDYSASADVAAFSGSTPWPTGSPLKSHQESPDFRRQIPARAFATLGRDRDGVHLQYLQAPTQQREEKAYDYFMLSCGPQTLAERHSAVELMAELQR